MVPSGGQAASVPRRWLRSARLVALILSGVQVRPAMPIEKASASAPERSHGVSPVVAGTAEDLLPVSPACAVELQAEDLSPRVIGNSASMGPAAYNRGCGRRPGTAAQRR